MSTFQTVATEFASAFETSARASGERFTRLKDESPEWMTDAIFAAHCALDDRSPDDWIYEACKRVADELSEIADPGDDTAYDIADRLTDTATHALLTWLASHIRNADIVDQANEDYGTFEMFGDDYRSRKKPENPTLVHMVQCVQLYAYRAICEAVLQAIRERAEGNTCCPGCAS